MIFIGLFLFSVFPALLHVLLLVLLALPILFMWLPGQPGHQATAAAWAVGLLFLAGLWLGHSLVSSGLIIWRYRVSVPTLLTVLGMHVISASVIGTLLYLVAWIFW